MWRQGREDFINNALVAFPGNWTREQGTPGNPTPQLVTEDLGHGEVDRATDRIKPQEKDQVDLRVEGVGGPENDKPRGR